LTVGFFSPLPPAPTGVADYSAALLAELRKHAVVNVDAADASDADAALYHLGNNRLHREIYARALEKPGIAVLHDATLNHFLLGTLDESAYIAEFVYNYGEWMRDLGRELWRNRARSAADPRYFDYGMLKRIATGSRSVIVHNPAAVHAIERHAPGVRVFEIPHFFAQCEIPDPIETLRFRAALGLRPRTLLVGVFGHLRESKRVPVVLRAMNCAWARGADARLVIAGPFASSDLEKSLTPLLSDPRILRAGYLSESDFWRYAGATDLCVNLRFPSAAESSGIAIRMMGIGKAVAFTAGEEVARIPENACLRVDLGPAEEEILADTIVWLAGDREAAAAIGAHAARHIAASHSLEKVAEQYWAALRTS
jgi:glycosyltransferase involved in cell wall biosynthesis